MIIHKIRLLHKELYEIGNKLPKREKLGIHAATEKCCLELFTTTITAAFEGRQNKITLLKTARVCSQMFVHLLRTEYELGILKEKAYLRLSAQLTEIAKMLTGWITYQTQKESR